MKYYKLIVFCSMFTFLGFNIYADDPAIESMEYYKLHFEKKPKHILADTLFERTVWHKKVSHIVLEERQDTFRVTLLMILPHPHNYKSQNYAIYYQFDNYTAAFKKLVWLDDFLKHNGVARVTLDGSLIVKENILYEESKQTAEK